MLVIPPTPGVLPPNNFNVTVSSYVAAPPSLESTIVEPLKLIDEGVTSTPFVACLEGTSTPIISFLESFVVM